jgi:hypothetical protein
MNVIPTVGPTDSNSLPYNLGDSVKVAASGVVAGVVVGIDPSTGMTWTNNAGTNATYPSTSLTLNFVPGWYRRPDEPFAPPTNNDVVVAYRATVEAYPAFTVPVKVSDA